MGCRKIQGTRVLRGERGDNFNRGDGVTVKVHKTACIATLTLAVLLVSSLSPAFLAQDAVASSQGLGSLRSVTVIPLANNTTVTTACWAVNESICVTSQSHGGNVVPQTPPQLGANYTSYPVTGENLYFNVYSEYNLTKDWGGTSSTEEYSGWDSFLYLSVTDVQWNGVPWFCQCDGTVWHADSGADWAPVNGTAVNYTETYMIYPHVPANNFTNQYCVDKTSWYSCTLSSHFLYVLEISGQGQSSNGALAPNFPAGAFLVWNVTSVRYSSGGVALHNSTSSAFGGYFWYYIKDSWFWSNQYAYGCSYTGSSGAPPCYPDTPGSPLNPNCPVQNGNLSASAFGCNLNVVIDPAGQPSLGTSVQVNISVNKTWNIYSGGEIQSALLYLSAYLPNGTFWMNWESGFKVGPAGWPAANATVILPSGFFQNANDTVDFYIVAYDQASDEIISQNYTDVTSPVGTFNNTNFTFVVNMTTDPTDIGMEAWNGSMANGSVPLLSSDQQLNVTINSINPLVNIQSAAVYDRVDFLLSASPPVTGAYSFHFITRTHYYVDLPFFPDATNVSFIVKAEDYNGDIVTSHIYKFSTPHVITVPPTLGFFYVQVYDNASKTYVTGANVSIIGEDGIIQIKTSTLAGLAYPNVTGQQFTPQFLPVNTTYTITVTYLNFDAAGYLNNTHSLRVSIFLTHTMTGEKRLLAGANYLVQQKGDIIAFSLNIPPPGQTFSEPVQVSLQEDFALVGMVAATALVYPVYLMWREIRKKAEEEEKRITL